MRIQKMSKEDFLAVPARKSFDEDIGSFNSLVIIPMDYLHDSGYLCMDFVAVDSNDEPICRLSGCSDVIHIDGIGGYGDWVEKFPTTVEPKGWSIDCLPCGLLRLFCNTRNGLKAGEALSDFSIYGKGIEQKVL